MWTEAAPGCGLCTDEHRLPSRALARTLGPTTLESVRPCGPPLKLPRAHSGVSVIDLPSYRQSTPIHAQTHSPNAQPPAVTTAAKLTAVSRGAAGGLALSLSPSTKASRDHLSHPTHPHPQNSCRSSGRFRPAFLQQPGSYWSLHTFVRGALITPPPTRCELSSSSGPTDNNSSSTHNTRDRSAIELLQPPHSAVECLHCGVGLTHPCVPPHRCTHPLSNAAAAQHDGGPPADVLPGYRL